jgi:hypothetical protein
VALVIVAGVACGCDRLRALTMPLRLALFGRATIADRVAEYGDGARARLQPYFSASLVPYPPARVVLVGLKRERRILVYAAPPEGAPRWIRSYPVLAASGRLGPKLARGDRQVPEGLYRIESLNPNSQFHLALRVDYPNAADRARAAADGRVDLGGDIMIHGAAVSVGCLAIGDVAAEELFVLVADVAPEHVDVILAPIDFRTAALPPRSDLPRPPWIDDLYDDIRRALADLEPTRDTSRVGEEREHGTVVARAGGVPRPAKPARHAWDAR